MSAEQSKMEWTKGYGYSNSALQREEPSAVGTEEGRQNQENGKYNVNVEAVKGNDKLSEAMRAVYSGKYTVYKAARIYGVNERTLHRRIKRRQTEGVVKKGRKYQMLPSEEKKFAEYLQLMSMMNINKTEAEFLDEVKLHFDRIQVKTDFELNRPGHGWYSKFMKRNEHELTGHTMSPRRKRLLKRVQDIMEMARNMCLAKRVQYNMHNMFLATTETYKIVEEKHLTMMVMINSAGKSHNLVCYPAEIPQQDMKEITSEYCNIDFLATQNGKMDGSDYAEAASRMFPVCDQRKAVLCVFPKEAYTYSLHCIAARRNICLVALHSWLNDLLQDQKHVFSRITFNMTHAKETLMTENLGDMDLLSTLLKSMCSAIIRNTNKMKCSRTCELYGIFPMGSYWLFRNIHKLEITAETWSKVEHAQGSKPSSHNTIRPRTPRKKRVAQVEGPYSMDHGMQDNAGSETNPTDAYSILQKAKVRPLLLRVMKQKVRLRRRPPRSQDQIAADNKWQEEEREARRKYWNRILPLRTQIRRFMCREKSRRRMFPKPTTDPCSLHYMPDSL